MNLTILNIHTCLEKGLRNSLYNTKHLKIYKFHFTIINFICKNKYIIIYLFKFEINFSLKGLIYSAFILDNCYLGVADRHLGVADLHFKKCKNRRNISKYRRIMDKYRRIIDKYRRKNFLQGYCIIVATISVESSLLLRIL